MGLDQLASGNSPYFLFTWNLENLLQLSRHATCSMRLQTHMIGLGSRAHLIVCFVDSTCTRIVKACVQSCPIHFNILCWPFEAKQRRLVSGSMGSCRAARVAGGAALGFIVMAIFFQAAVRGRIVATVQSEAAMGIIMESTCQKKK